MSPAIRWSGSCRRWRWPAAVRCVVCAADLPFVTGELVAQLAGADPGGAPAVLAAWRATSSRCWAAISRRALELLQRTGSVPDRPLRECIAAIEPATLEVSDPDLLFNVNTPDDLLQAAAMLDRWRARAARTTRT